MTKRLIKQKSAAAAAVAVGIVPAGAQQFDADKWLSYEAGPAVILPKAQLGMTYDSDVFLGTSPTSQSDIYFNVRPEIEATIGAQDLSYLRFSYAPNYLKFLETDLLTRVDHVGTFNVRIDRPKTTVNGTTQVQKIGGFLGDFQNFAINPTDRLIHNHNYRLLQNISGKVSGSLAFSYAVQDYDSKANLLDTQSWRVTAGSVYDLSEKLDLLGEVFYGKGSSSVNANPTLGTTDATEMGFYVGAEAEFTPKLTGEVRLGFQNYKFDGAGDASAVTSEVQLNYELSPLSRIGLVVSRGISQSIQIANNSFVYTDIGVNYAQMLDAAGRWGANTAIRYRFSEFDGAAFAGRTDNFFTYSAGLSYFMNDWLQAGLQYSYNDFSTNLGAQEYSVHRIGVNVSVGY